MSDSGFTEPLSIAPGNPTEIRIVEKLASESSGCDYCYGNGLGAFQPEIVCDVQGDGCVARLVERSGS